MLKHHQNMIDVPDTATLWRYMTFTKFVELLQSSNLYFAALNRMEDNYEGWHSKKSLEMSEAGIRRGFSGQDAAGLSDVLSMFKKSTEFTKDWARRSMFVSCWHSNVHESAAMWKLYLTTNEGVAIRTTLANAREAFAAAEADVYASSVRYIDFNTDPVPLDNIFSRVVYKRKSFEHEQEVRFIHWAPKFDQDVLLQDVPGVKIPVNLALLVQHVYVAPLAPPWFLDVVRNTATKYGLDAPITQSDLYADPVW